MKTIKLYRNGRFHASYSGRTIHMDKGIPQAVRNEVSLWEQGHLTARSIVLYGVAWSWEAVAVNVQTVRLAA